MNELSTVEVLRRVRDRIATPDRWIKGRYSDRPRDLTTGRAKGDPDTCRVCLVAAVKWALYGRPEEHYFSRRERLVRALLEQAAGEPPTYFNDAPSTTHADVLAVVDRAILLAEADQGVC